MRDGSVRGFSSSIAAIRDYDRLPTTPAKLTPLANMFSRIERKAQFLRILSGKQGHNPKRHLPVIFHLSPPFA